MLRALFMLLLLVPRSVWGDVTCDGIDDDLVATGLDLTNFITASTGSMVLVYIPTGTAAPSSSGCWQGENLLSDGSGGYAGLFRNGDMGFTGDKLCAANWDGTATFVGVPYTVGVRVHLAWVHFPGQLWLYKDGVATAAFTGDTESLTAAAVRLCSPGAGEAVPAQGRFIEAKMYNVALSAADIATEATSGVHNVIPVAATARWNFDDCSVGTTGNGVAFLDRSGNGRTINGSWGASGSGLLCNGSSLAYPWGVW